MHRSLDRASRLIPPSRLVSIVTRDQIPAVGLDHPWLGAHRCILPSARGTAPEALLATLRIVRHDPRAIVAVLPADHLIEYGPRLMDGVARATAAVGARRDLPVLVGACRGAPDPDYAWIEPGAPVDGLEAFGVHAVERFVTRPAWEEPEETCATVAIVAAAALLLATARRYLPEVTNYLEPLANLIDEPLRGDTMWESVPTASLCADVLALVEDLAMVSIPGAIAGMRSRPLVTALAS